MEEIKKRGHDLAIKLIQKLRLDHRRRTKSSRTSRSPKTSKEEAQAASPSEVEAEAESPSFEFQCRVDGNMAVFTTILQPSEDIGQKLLDFIEDASQQMKVPNCSSATVSTQTDDSEMGQVIVEMDPPQKSLPPLEDKHTAVKPNPLPGRDTPQRSLPVTKDKNASSKPDPPQNSVPAIKDKNTSNKPNPLSGRNLPQKSMLATEDKNVPSKTISPPGKDTSQNSVSAIKDKNIPSKSSPPLGRDLSQQSLLAMEDKNTSNKPNTLEKDFSQKCLSATDDKNRPTCNKPNLTPGRNPSHKPLPAIENKNTFSKPNPLPARDPTQNSLSALNDKNVSSKPKPPPGRHIPQNSLPAVKDKNATNKPIPRLVRGPVQKSVLAIEDKNTPNKPKPSPVKTRRRKTLCCKRRHPFCMSIRQHVVLELLSPVYFVPSEKTRPKWVSIPIAPIPLAPYDMHIFRFPVKQWEKGCGERTPTAYAKPPVHNHVNIGRIYVDEERASRVYRDLCVSELADKSRVCRRCENKRKKPIKPTGGRKMQPANLRTPATRHAEIELTVLQVCEGNSGKAADRWSKESERQMEHPPLSFISRYEWCIRLVMFYVGLHEAKLRNRNRIIFN